MNLLVHLKTEHVGTHSAKRRGHGNPQIQSSLCAHLRVSCLYVVVFILRCVCVIFLNSQGPGKVIQDFEDAGLTMCA